MPGANHYVYGLRDLKIGSWTSEASYGTIYDIDAANSFTVTFGVQSDSLMGDDVEKDRYAKIVRVEANLSYGSVNQRVLEILTGGTLVSDAEYENVLIDQDDNVPYFTIAGRVVGSNAGDMHIHIAKAKLAGNLSYQAQQNGYLIPSAQIVGVHEGDTNGFGHVRNFFEATALEIPLRTTGGFA